MQCLRDSPGDGTVVGDTHNQAPLAAHETGAHHPRLLLLISAINSLLRHHLACPHEPISSKNGIARMTCGDFGQ
jgi:hypothetical protein